MDQFKQWQPVGKAGRFVSLRTAMIRDTSIATSREDGWRDESMDGGMGGPPLHVVRAHNQP